MSMPKYGSVGGDDGNSYVPNMTHHAHIGLNNECSVLIEDSVADGTLLLAAITTAAATTYVLAEGANGEPLEIAEPFGRTLGVDSTDADGVIIIHGRDYLGQQMSEQVTCVSNAGATAKAFKWVDSIESVSNVGDVNLDAGAGYGLPFCAVELVREVVNGAAATEGTLTAAVTTTPSTTTGDVRGTYNPNTAGDGAKDIEVVYVTTNRLTGGLYGQVQA